MEEVSFDDLMQMVRQGEVVCTLVEGKLYWKAKNHNPSIARAVQAQRKALTKMLEYGDTRVCCNVSSHAPHYRQAAPWYTCPDCQRSREDLARRHQAARQAREMASQATIVQN